MRAFRAWHVVILVCLVFDLGNPHVPGIFSVLNGELFMDGVTRAHGADAGAKCLRDCPRVPVPFQAEDDAASAGPRVATLDARRTYTRSHSRRPVHVAVRSPLDTEDH